MKVNLQSVNFKADQKLLEFVQERMDKLDTYYDNINYRNYLINQIFLFLKISLHN